MNKLTTFTLLLFSILLISFSGCEQPKYPEISNYPDKPLVTGNVHIIRLERSVDEFLYSDVFPSDFIPDSVTTAQKEVSLRFNKAGVAIQISPNVPPVFTIGFWNAGFAYTLPVFRTDKEQILFELSPTSLPALEINKVQIAGTFNGWNPAGTFMTKSSNKEDAVWQAGIPLSAGKHPYQIVVNDRWILDPANPDSMDNNVGGFNSIKTVSPPPKITLITNNFSNNKITINVDQACQALAWMDYALIPITQNENQLIIDIPSQAQSGYHWITVLGYTAEGKSNDLRIPILNGQVIKDPTLEGRKNKQAMTMYFALVDRFADGDDSNNKPLNDPRVAPRADYQGGDLKGINDKLNYIKELGCNTLWLSPITQNPETAYQEYPEPQRWFSGYHGYWPILYTKVDHRFGTSDQMQSLVDEAHNKDINVLLDFVCNHVHESHPIYQQNPNWGTDLILANGRKNLRLWDEERLTTWFDEFLPSLDLANQEVTDLVSDSALFWIDKYGIDGFRHDATKHVPELFWRTLTSKLRARYPDRLPYQIGETFGSRDLIASYLAPGKMEAQFDFPLYFSTRAVLTSDQGSFKTLAAELQASLDIFGHHHLMGNITGNHDMPRFTSLAGGAIKAGEDPKEVGWQRNIGVGDPIAYDRLKLLQAFNCAIPGIPVVYYGDEIGMPGASDP
ncbi:MAG: cyclomaltodextrinase, partial [Limisphaerales bacterium]